MVASMISDASMSAGTCSNMMLRIVKTAQAGAQVQAMAQRLFDPARIAVTLLGRLDGIKLNRTRLVC